MILADAIEALAILRMAKEAQCGVPKNKRKR